MELPQKPYVDGNGKEKDANLRISYFPRGFTVGKVLSKDLSEVTDPDDDVTSVFDEFCPEKTALHVEVRVRRTRPVSPFTVLPPHSSANPLTARGST